MIRYILALMIFLTFGPARAAEPSKKAPEAKSGTSKESEEEATKTFTDQIKNVRVYGDDYDVFFVENGGPYDVPYAFANAKSDQLPEDIINDAFKNGSQVTVTVDNKTDTLISISRNGERGPASDSSPKSPPLPKALEAYKDIIQQALSPKN
jgi:hypothetical protein